MIRIGMSFKERLYSIKLYFKCVAFNIFGFTFRGIRLFRSPFIIRGAVATWTKDIQYDRHFMDIVLMKWLKKRIWNISKGKVEHKENKYDYNYRTGRCIIYIEHERGNGI